MKSNLLRKEFDKLFKSEFGRNFLTLFSGTTLAQVIPFIAAPVLTRLFTPAEYGLLALFTSTSLFLGNLATMQYDAAIMLPDNDPDALNVMALALISVLLMTLVTTIVVVLFNGFLCKLMGNQEMKFWLYLVPISVFLTGLFRTLNIWSSRKKQFRRLAARNITQTSTTTGSKIALGIWTKINGGLIIGSLLGQFTATSLLFFQTWRHDKIETSHIKKGKIFFLAKKYKDFPLYVNLQGFMDVFKSTGIRYVISNFFGAAILGAYSFTLGLLQRPAQMIGGAVSQVYFQKAAETYNEKGDLWGLTKKIMLRMTIVAFIIYIPILLLGPLIFKIIFSSKWEIAGKYAQILVPWFISSFLIQFSTKIPQVVNKQKQFFVISTVSNILLFSGVLLLSYFKFNFEAVLYLMTTFMILLIGYLLFWYKKITIK